MSTKIQSSAKSSKKAPAPALKAKPGKTTAPVKGASAAKGTSAKGAVVGKPAALAAKAAKGEELPATELPTIDPDEAEEQEDAARASASSSDGNAAALAAASGTTEMSASFKNFRHHPDMENFYRFIYENDLRHEALQIIDLIQLEKQQRRQMKGLKLNAH